MNKKVGARVKLLGQYCFKSTKSRSGVVSVLCRVGLLGIAVLTWGGSFRPRLNTGQSPIAHKYREGKMQRTLKKESKGLEIAQRETIETSLHLPFHRSSCPSFLVLVGGPSFLGIKIKGLVHSVKVFFKAGQHVFVRWQNLSRTHISNRVAFFSFTGRGSSPAWNIIKKGDRREQKPKQNTQV